jgi:hypothetical protein
MTIPPRVGAFWLLYPRPDQCTARGELTHMMDLFALGTDRLRAEGFANRVSFMRWSQRALDAQDSGVSSIHPSGGITSKGTPPLVSES